MPGLSGSENRIVKSQQSGEDVSAGFENPENFERFIQKIDIFRRSWWDYIVRRRKPASWRGLTEV